MLTAFTLTFGQLPTPEFRRLVIASLFWSVVVFVALWVGIGALIETNLGANQWLDWLVQVLGGVASLVLAWLLFPAVATMILGCYAESIIRAVEHRHYPWLGEPPGPSWRVVLGSGLRLVGLSLITNIAALPFYLLFPGINYLVFSVLNGYLLSRENFDLVALRRLGQGEARALWQAHRFVFVISGMIFVGLFTIPLVNLIAPLVSIAVVVHLVERLRDDTSAGPRALRNRAVS
ncbi:MAG TPA: EI24 domain-containing protein [Stellaceae bacterium]|nr:EI24 domain-containing protein [Stellaceae bacterium]